MALRWFSSTSEPRGSKSIWLESPSVFWQAVTTFLRWTFVGAISVVLSRICRLCRCNRLIEFYSSSNSDRFGLPARGPARRRGCRTSVVSPAAIVGCRISDEILPADRRVIDLRAVSGRL